MTVLSYLAAIAIGYLLGSFPSGYVVGRLRGVDVRQWGSGSLGGTNVLRSAGPWAAILAVLGGQIIPHATLLRKYYGSKSHIGNIRISVDPSFRGKHLATWMLLDLINLAMAMGLETIIMQLVEDRDAALIRSVKKLEFFEKAVLKDYAKDREGNPHNLVIMVKRLHRLWDDVRVDTP